jgi:integrase
MAKAERLTAQAIEKMKPGKARREIPDAGCPGLYLQIQPTGQKSWALRFRSPVDRSAADGQRAARKLTLGPLAAVSLAKARALATDALEQVAQGVDPTHTRQAEKDRAREAIAGRADTIDAAMVEFLTRYKGRKTQGLRESTRLLTATYFGLKPDPTKPGAWKKTGSGVLKRWSGRPLSSIAKRDAIALIEDIVDAGTGVTANRTLTNLKTFFGWCVKRDMLAASPVAALDPAAAETSRERVLTEAELAALWKAADADGYPFGRLIQLAILTGARRDELCSATWGEFDLDAGTWLLPAARAKNGRAHLVPLAPMAVDILRGMPRHKGCALLFTTTGTTPISGLYKPVRRLHDAMGAAERWTLHDLRRSFYSGLQALGFPIEVTEACVNHTGGTLRGVAKVYGRHDYKAEKTQAFEAWARHVDGLVNGRDSNVVAFVR